MSNPTAPARIYAFERDAEIKDMRDQLIDALVTIYSLSRQAINNIDIVLETTYIAGRIEAKAESLLIMARRELTEAPSPADII